MRDEFPASVKEELAKRVGYLCSNPGCRQPTSGPQSTSSGTVNIGVAAHISAASAGGPRYEMSLSPDERRATTNGIWLCQTCAKLVDSDTAGFTPEKLIEWKRDAESAAAKALHNRRSPAAGSLGVFQEAERLMPKLIAEMRADFRSDESQLIREFILLPSASATFWSDKQRLAYYETDHPQLKLQLDWLEEMGLIVNVTPKNTPIYRIVPEFVDWLRGPT